MNILAVIIVTLVALFVCAFVVFKQQNNKVKSLLSQLEEKFSFSYCTDRPVNAIVENVKVSNTASGLFDGLMDNKLFKLTTTAMTPFITMIAFEPSPAKITEIVDDDVDLELENQLKLLEEMNNSPEEATIEEIS
jgi:hypothetical protein